MLDSTNHRWQMQQGDRIESITLRGGVVLLETHDGATIGISGVAATYAEFLSGNLTGLIETTFGRVVLDEVRTAVAAGDARRPEA